MRLQFLIMPRMSPAVPRSRRDVSLNRRKAPCRKRLARVVQEQPLAVALAGVAAGAAVAAAFPVTELENRTLGTTGEQMREAAGKAGEQLKDAASKAGQRLAAAADRAGPEYRGF